MDVGISGVGVCWVDEVRCSSFSISCLVEVVVWLLMLMLMVCNICCCSIEAVDTLTGIVSCSCVIMIVCVRVYRFDLTASGWSDGEDALPLTYTFGIVRPPSVSSSSSSSWETSFVPITDALPVASVVGRRLPLPSLSSSSGSSSSSVYVAVRVQNAMGGEAMSAPFAVSISPPSLSSIASGVLNATSSTGSSTDAATLAARSSAVVDTLAKLGESLTGEIASSSEDADSFGALEGVSATVTALQVLQCVSVECGSGVCTVRKGKAVCDCEGTGRSGSHCQSNGGGGASGGSSTSSVSQTPSPSLSLSRGVSPSASPSSPALKMKECESSTSVECSGHGVCVRSVPGCVVGDVSCTVSCRYDMLRGL